jgi:hypothetical protein
LQPKDEGKGSAGANNACVSGTLGIPIAHSLTVVPPASLLAMPELPEVEFTRRRIAPLLVGRRIARVRTSKGGTRARRECRRSERPGYSQLAEESFDA